MVEVKIIDKEAFKVSGKKTWISGQNNEEFAAFWQESNENGFVDELKKICSPQIMQEGILGISRVEKDPSYRAFDFYICCETDKEVKEGDSFVVDAQKWAVFSNHGDNLGQALFEAEMYCHMTWLKDSGYEHAYGVEMEVYPAHDGTLVEYWVPIVKIGE